MKIKNRLLLSSGIIIFLLLFTGAFSLWCLSEVDSGYSDSYVNHTEVIPHIVAVRAEVQSLRIAVSNARADRLSEIDYHELISLQNKRLETAFADALVHISAEKAISGLDDIYLKYQNELLPLVEEYGELTGLYTYAEWQNFDQAASGITASLDILIDEMVASGTEMSNQLTDLASRTAIILIAVLLSVVIISIIISFTAIISIHKPIDILEKATMEISHGNLMIDIPYSSKNELGMLSESVRKSTESLFSYIRAIEICLNELGSGNFSYEVPDIFEGDFRAIKDALERVASLLQEQQANDLRGRKELERAYVMADQANKAKSDFLSHMSHDIRTPMNAVVGLTGIALDNVEDVAKVRDCLKKINQSGVLLTGLINDVLDMSRIESGKMVLNNDNTTLPEIMENIVNVSYSQIKAKKLQFSIRLHEITHENVYCDSLRLNQVFINILSNAVKFTPVGNSITIDVSELESVKPGFAHFQFVFADTGIGMTEDFSKDIFSTFSRESNETVRRTEGSGLGMAICKSIVDIMEGTISIDSKVGEGSVFTINLHLKIADLNAKDMFLPGMNILVVDDDVIMCKTAVSALSEMKVNAKWVDNGLDAIAMVADMKDTDNLCDVIIMDLQMPDINGIETTRRIRDLVGPDIPIIIMSAYDWSDFSEEAQAVGVNGFVAKPLFKSTMYYAITNLVLKGQGISPDSETDSCAFDFSGKRIMLVEDNEINQMVAEEMLKKTHIEVICIDNGQEALNSFQNSEPFYYDAILMDIQMPIMNGYEATQKIRHLHRPDAPSIPIIAMTANAFSEDVEAALRSGMDSHISKPVDRQKLLREIGKYI